MRSFRRCLLLCGCLVGTVSAQSIDDTIEFTYQAFLQETSPIADAVIGANEYSNSTFLSFVDEENPGNPFPGLNQMCGLVDCTDDDIPDGANDTEIGDADLSATIYWGYTDTTFFMAFDVTDQFVDFELPQAEPFNNDGVELVIDSDADGEDERNFSLEGFKMNTDVSVETGNPGTQDGNGPVWVEEGPSAGEWTHASALTETGYIIEFEIPLGSIDTESDVPQTIDPADAVAAKTGDTLRMNFAINDIDIEGGNQGSGTHAMWWVYEDNPASPWGGAEGNWVVGMELAGPGGNNNPCDFDGDGSLGEGDVNMLREEVILGRNDLKFDVNGDGAVTSDDVSFFVSDADKLNSYIGDSNLDGEFNSSDFVLVFEEGLFETGNAATWKQGDWNADGVFGSGDLVAAFQQGGFEIGPRAATAAVPEPSSIVLISLGCLAMLQRRRK